MYFPLYPEQTLPTSRVCGTILLGFNLYIVFKICCDTIFGKQLPPPMLGGEKGFCKRQQRFLDFVTVHEHLSRLPLPTATKSRQSLLPVLQELQTPVSNYGKTTTFLTILKDLWTCFSISYEITKFVTTLKCLQTPVSIHGKINT